jgi:hypothetical protein
VSAPTIGLFAVNSHECARPEAAARVAGLAHLAAHTERIRLGTGVIRLHGRPAGDGRAARADAGRHRGAGRERPLHVSVTPSRRLDRDVVSGYAELGVERLIVAPPAGLSLEELLEFVERNAPAELGAASLSPPGGSAAPGAR